MSTSTRWTVAFLAVFAVLIVALALELRDPSAPPRRSSAAEPGQTTNAADLTELRVRANLPGCPAPGVDRGPESLRDITVQCLADGSTVDVGRSVGGRAVVLNLWSYWCGPCADELPAMADYQRKMGTDLTVITVHQDPDQAAALTRLADWDVRLPTWQDPDRRVAAALRVPNVVPATVVLRADGSLAGILPRAFVNADEIAAAVDQAMGERR